MGRRSGCPKIRLTAIAGFVACAVCPAGGRAQAEPLVLEGPARIVDNATIEIWGQRIRLDGIITPDPDSAVGRKGKQFLVELLSDVTVRCVTLTPFYPTVVPGHCFAGDVDIGRSLVNAGYARQGRNGARTVGDGDETK